MFRILFLILTCFINFAIPVYATQESIENSSEEMTTICSTTDCYTIIEKLGEGAFGKVYAVENSSGERFALKTYKRPLATDEPAGSSTSSTNSFFSTLDDLEREFERGRALDHPNIIKSYDFFTSPSPSDAENAETRYLVLQLVEGKTVYETLRKSLSQEEAAIAASRLSEALHYALSMGYFHLDLHMGNVMVSNQAEVMVIDLASFFSFEEIFGYAKEQTESSKNKKTVKGIVANAPSSTMKSPVRAEKLRQFFIRHPKLLTQLQQAVKTCKKDSSIKTVISSEHSSSEERLEAYKSSFKAYYFNQIAEMCRSLISKSNGSKEERINKYAEIKKLAWNYAEDNEEGENACFEEYMTKLFDVLQPE